MFVRECMEKSSAICILLSYIRDISRVVDDISVGLVLVLVNKYRISLAFTTTIVDTYDMRRVCASECAYPSPSIMMKEQ